MLETAWPRVRTLARGVAFVAALAVIAGSILSILQTPVGTPPAGTEPTRAIAAELLAITAAAGVAVAVTR